MNEKKKKSNDTFSHLYKENYYNTTFYIEHIPISHWVIICGKGQVNVIWSFHCLVITFTKD